MTIVEGLTFRMRPYFFPWLVRKASHCYRLSDQDLVTGSSYRCPCRPT